MFAQLEQVQSKWICPPQSPHAPIGMLCILPCESSCALATLMWQMIKFYFGNLYRTAGVLKCLISGEQLYLIFGNRRAMADHSGFDISTFRQRFQTFAKEPLRACQRVCRHVRGGCTASLHKPMLGFIIAHYSQCACPKTNPSLLRGCSLQTEILSGRQAAFQLF